MDLLRVMQIHLLTQTGSYLTASGISDAAFDTGSSPDSIVFFDATDSGVKREASLIS